MKKTRARKKTPARPRATETKPGEVAKARRPRAPATDDVHDAGHPGGLPALDAKTDWEAEHDTWWRHE